ncbi:hypothetical protein TrVGV298_012087 [Trichoderma virens]|nr:hypothetical protein TrVGV298_012087 [Trichoderma virens]
MDGRAIQALSPKRSLTLLCLPVPRTFRARFALLDLARSSQPGPGLAGDLSRGAFGEATVEVGLSCALSSPVPASGFCLSLGFLLSYYVDSSTQVPQSPLPISVVSEPNTPSGGAATPFQAVEPIVRLVSKAAWLPLPELQ